MPRAFQGRLAGLRTDLRVPITMRREVVSHDDRLDDRAANWLMAQGRLAADVKPTRARQELNLLMQRLAKQFPDAHVGHDEIGVYPLWRGPDVANAYLSTLLPMPMGLAGVVLLLACADAANLLMVRSMARRRDVAPPFDGGEPLLVVAGLFVRGFLLAQTFDPGVDADHVLAASYDLYPAGYDRRQGWPSKATRRNCTRRWTSLSGVSPTDGSTFAIVAARLAAVALAASAIPAWRAAKVGPIAALRHE